jgi:hypothetical protein
MAGNGKTKTVIIEGETFMATPNQIVWTGSTGLFVIPRNAESTARPFTPSEVTGGKINFASAPVELFVSAEEQEFASLLVAERKSLARKRIKPAAVNRAVKQLRYRR